MKVKPLQLDSAGKFWPGFFGLIHWAVHIASVYPCLFIISGN